MTPEEEQTFLDDRFGEDVCDDCSQGPDGHAVGVGPSGTPFVDCLEPPEQPKTGRA